MPRTHMDTRSETCPNAEQRFSPETIPQILPQILPEFAPEDAPTQSCPEVLSETCFGSLPKNPTKNKRRILNLKSLFKFFVYSSLGFSLGASFGCLFGCSFGSSFGSSFNSSFESSFPNLRFHGPDIQNRKHKTCFY